MAIAFSPMAPGGPLPPPLLSDVRIALLGKAGAGKNRVAKAILGDIELNEESEECVLYEGEQEGKSICIVDTPGWDRVSIECTTKKIKNEIARSVTLCPPGPHVLILVLPVHAGEVPSLNELQSTSRHVELLSERVWNYTMVLFLCERNVEDSTITAHIQKAEKLLEKCSGRHYVMRLSESETQVCELLKVIDSMVEENKDYFTLTEGSSEVIQGTRSTQEETNKKQGEGKSQEKHLLRQRRGSLSGTRPSMPEQEEDPKIQKAESAATTDINQSQLPWPVIKPVLVILMVLMGGLIGSVAGASYGTVGAAVGIVIGFIVTLPLSLWLIKVIT